MCHSGGDDFVLVNKPPVADGDDGLDAHQIQFS